MTLSGRMFCFVARVRIYVYGERAVGFHATYFDCCAFRAVGFHAVGVHKCFAKFSVRELERIFSSGGSTTQ